MNDNEKQVTSYQQDQEILDSRGIAMTVEEVAGLPTSKYAERVQELKLDGINLAFLKGLRRRIKNRLASQNSRRRSMEHLRRLTRELRAVKACRDDAVSDLKSLLQERDSLRCRCQRLREYVAKILKERSDVTPIPEIDIAPVNLESHITEAKEPKTLQQKDILTENLLKSDRDQHIFECCIEKLVEQSVQHIFKEKKVNAKTVFLEKGTMDSKYYSGELNSTLKGLLESGEGGVLNLSVKRESRRSHGRKQSAPRRIVYAFDEDDCVLDLKIKKENQ